MQNERSEYLMLQARRHILFLSLIREGIPFTVDGVEYLPSNFSAVSTARELEAWQSIIDVLEGSNPGLHS